MEAVHVGPLLAAAAVEVAAEEAVVVETCYCHQVVGGFCLKMEEVGFD